MLRWTPDLFDVFQQRRGYDLKVNLPALVEETGNWKKVRHDYYELILELFVDRWAKPWSKYCDEKNLDWTGHYWEHGWPEPTHGFDEAAFYIWHQMPGVDMLGNKLDTAGLGGQFGNERAVRELLSAANQAGRRRTLSETYGGGGWEMNFETQKRLADWEVVMGVNFVNQHLSYYSLIGLFNENGLAMGNPWQHKIQYKKTYLALDTLFKADSWFEASYHFNINTNLNAGAMKSIRAVVERPELWTVSINGKEVSKTEGSYWIDKSFPEFAVGEYLKPGKNTLTLKAPRMHVLAEVMPVYFIGDFLVKPAKQGFEITDGNISALGSWREAGLPFYSQKVAYSQTYNVPKADGTAFKVKLNKWNGSVAEVLVNGQQAGLIAWQPNELDVTSLLKDGDNEITVKVVGSLKNTFGYFFKEADKWIYGPHEWNYAPEKAPDASGYFLMDYGLMEPFGLVQVK